MMKDESVRRSLENNLEDKMCKCLAGVARRLNREKRVRGVT